MCGWRGGNCGTQRSHGVSERLACVRYVRAFLIQIPTLPSFKTFLVSQDAYFRLFSFILLRFPPVQTADFTSPTSLRGKDMYLLLQLMIRMAILLEVGLVLLVRLVLYHILCQ